MANLVAAAVMRAVAAIAVLLMLLTSVLFSPPLRAADGPALWQALRDGAAFAMLRHALAPGYGDPEGFVLGECSTQRNLSTHGRGQAEEVGRRMRDNGIRSAEVHSSQWCRCRDTAALLRLGPVHQQPLLNSFYDQPDRAAPQTAALERWLVGLEPGTPRVLVTHQVVIRAITGQATASGEMVVVRHNGAGAFEVLGRL